MTIYRRLIFPDDPRFFNPPSMIEAIAEQLDESGQSIADGPSAIAKMILDSLAFRYASVLRGHRIVDGSKYQRRADRRRRQSK